jgi:glycogen debranching enzyme
MFEAAVHFDFRLPELFCGFSRHSGEGPIAYPVACKPQAWAAGSVFMYLQACLGIRIEARSRIVHVNRPSLPREIEHLTIDRLPVGDRFTTLEFQRMVDRTVVQAVGLPDEAVKLLVHL